MAETPTADGLALSAPGLTLRPWRPGDVPALLAAHRHPDLRRWITTNLASTADARRWIDEQGAAWTAGTRFNFAVTMTMTEAGDRGAGGDDVAGRLVGEVLLKVVPDSARPGAAAEVGYWTVPEARGKGVAPRALEALSRWALAAPHLTPAGRLELLHTVANTSSCRTALKCGYVLDSVLPPFPPDYPGEGHLHVRTNDAARARLA
ncbi:GNAT family N-acetyltransferase [Streptomyces sp. NPDC005562]|uniref:GNAT family N-acetyltransferase n=1 Tax=Streptomyces sp. NPDC005562 TaxID=3154890 RepID=UPI0033B6B3CE